MKNIFYFVIGWPLFQSSSIAQVWKRCILLFCDLEPHSIDNYYHLRSAKCLLSDVHANDVWLLHEDLVVATFIASIGNWLPVQFSTFLLFLMHPRIQLAIGCTSVCTLPEEGIFQMLELHLIGIFFFIVAWEVKLKNRHLLVATFIFFNTVLKHPRNHLAVGCTSVCTPMEKFEHMVSYF